MSKNVKELIYELREAALEGKSILFKKTLELLREKYRKNKSKFKDEDISKIREYGDLLKENVKSEYETSFQDTFGSRDDFKKMRARQGGRNQHPKL